MRSREHVPSTQPDTTDESASGVRDVVPKQTYPKPSMKTDRPQYTPEDGDKTQVMRMPTREKKPQTTSLPAREKLGPLQPMAPNVANMFAQRGSARQREARYAREDEARAREIGKRLRESAAADAFFQPSDDADQNPVTEISTERLSAAPIPLRTRREHATNQQTSGITETSFMNKLRTLGSSVVRMFSRDASATHLKPSTENKKKRSA